MQKNSNKKKPKSTRKRWIIFSAILLIFIVIVALYETQQELKRNQNQSIQPNLTLLERSQKATSSLKKYYRYHDLPVDWEVGEIIAEGIPESPTITTSLYFTPSLRSSRHGQASTPGEITSIIACPKSEAPWKDFSEFQIIIELNDKNGFVEKFKCINL